MKFDNTVKTEWLEKDPRKMILLEEVNFTDSLGVVWRAPAGSIIDGASIPRFFWRFIGSPFVGRYRRASVVHDVYCVTKERSYQDVHEMFNQAMIADNVPLGRRIAMAQAVERFGPRWDEDGNDLPVPNPDDEDLLDGYYD